ncbi:hypothetical protein CDL15_Pgr014038 [Punica granatum]|uniref:Uncharacterized protein n=1 Tax=Punica granatum TaxID=22663 RepID=A0A218W9N1_PUNGR|nr:hypothetical protein CDL15_Pgr014038 [Punica granatum]
MPRIRSWSHVLENQSLNRLSFSPRKKHSTGEEETVIPELFKGEANLQSLWKNRPHEELLLGSHWIPILALQIQTQCRKRARTWTC